MLGTMVNKSKVVTELFNALYHISSRKTTEGYAYSLMKLIKEEFEENYPFFSSFDSLSDLSILFSGQLSLGLTG